MRIKSKVAIVTGGAQGIGAAFCEALLKRGAKVVIVDINSELGEETCKTLKQQYGEEHVIFTACDVSSELDFRHTFEIAKENFNSIDIVCNNAGIAESGDWESEMDVWDRVVDVNLKGVIYGTKLALQSMSKKNGGTGGVVINMASMAGYLPMPDAPVYTATKCGIIGFTRSMDGYYESDGVRINAICPSHTCTPLMYSRNEVSRKLYGDDYIEKRKAMAVSADEVASGMIQLVEDDTRNGAIMRVIFSKGVDYKDYPSSKELLEILQNPDESIDSLLAKLNQ